MDSSLIVFDAEPQLKSWSWGPLLGYCRLEKPLVLSDRFNPLGLPNPEGTRLLVCASARACNLFTRAAAGMFVFSDHTLRETDLAPNGQWNQGKAAIGITPVTIFANKWSNRTMGMVDGLLATLSAHQALSRQYTI